MPQRQRRTVQTVQSTRHSKGAVLGGRRSLIMQRQVPAVLGMQTERKTVDFPQMQFLDKVLDMPVEVQRVV